MVKPNYIVAWRTLNSVCKVLFSFQQKRQYSCKEILSLKVAECIYKYNSSVLVRKPGTSLLRSVWVSRERRKEWGLTDLGTGKQSFLERIGTQGTKDMQFTHNGRLAPNTGTIQVFFYFVWDWSGKWWIVFDIVDQKKTKCL